MRVIIGTASSGRVTVEHGWKALEAGASPLDALQVGLMAAEADEALTDIGYGGMPDASGSAAPVVVRGFYLGETEITVGQMRGVIPFAAARNLLTCRCT